MGGPSSSPRCIGGKLQHGLRCHGRFKFWHFGLRADRHRRSSLTNRLATDWIHAPFPLGSSLGSDALDGKLELAASTISRCQLWWRRRTRSRAGVARLGRHLQRDADVCRRSSLTNWLAADRIHAQFPMGSSLGSNGRTVN